MEIPCLELEDLKLAKLVTDLLAPLVITAEKQEKMIRVLEEELDLGLQHGLSGQPLQCIGICNAPYCDLFKRAILSNNVF